MQHGSIWCSLIFRKAGTQETRLPMTSGEFVEIGVQSGSLGGVLEDAAASAGNRTFFEGRGGRNAVPESRVIRRPTFVRSSFDDDRRPCTTHRPCLRFGLVSGRFDPAKTQFARSGSASDSTHPFSGTLATLPCVGKQSRVGFVRLGWLRTVARRDGSSMLRASHQTGSVCRVRGTDQRLLPLRSHESWSAVKKGR